MVVALVAGFTVGVGVTAWLARVVSDVTPKAVGVWVVCYFTHLVIVVTHVIAGAIARDGVAVATDSVTLVPSWALGRGCTLVSVTDIVVTNLITVLKTGGQEKKSCN